MLTDYKITGNYPRNTSAGFRLMTNFAVSEDKMATRENDTKNKKNSGMFPERSQVTYQPLPIFATQKNYRH